MGGFKEEEEDEEIVEDELLLLLLLLPLLLLLVVVLLVVLLLLMLALSVSGVWLSLISVFLLNWIQEESNTELTEITQKNSNKHTQKQ